MTPLLKPSLKSQVAYTPGTQPKGRGYIKLNTNEMPYRPSLRVYEAISTYKWKRLRLYPQPNPEKLKNAIADCHGVEPKNISLGNGSDEVLAFAFTVFFERGDAIAFPDITYGLYETLSGLYGLSPIISPLGDDFTLDIEGLAGINAGKVIANPNAPTGISVSVEEIEKILKAAPDKIVIVDEAYADFCGENCISLIEKYPNLLIVRTFSKSRALAGARVGYAVGCEDVIEALELVRNSFNPYNLNALSIESAAAAVLDKRYFKRCVKRIMRNRNRLCEKLAELGFSVLPSGANFVFAKHESIHGKDIFEKLEQKKILVRRWDSDRISEYLRISIGTKIQMAKLIKELKKICKT
jgi:histidinol-phosphate aminotransferase